MQEIIRVKNFSHGDVECIKCKNQLRLYFNGGELDQVECCGHVYATEHAAIDLVIYKKEERS